MAFDLKKEEDVKEFLDNLGIEYRFGCFSEKRADSCHLLGDYLEGVKKDFDKAAKVFRTNCDDSSYAKSCYKFANYCFLGKGGKQNMDDAYSYYLKGCSAGDPDSCLNGGLMCVSNTPTVQQRPKDYDKGLELLDKACTGNNAFSCYYISGIFIQGVKDVVAKDMGKAFDYSNKACTLGNMYACANVSQMYRKGDGVDKSEEKSEEFKKKALDLQNEYKEQMQIQFQQGTKPV
ncbi:cytochrome c oxidase assembly factor 7 homolog [Penaeus japonicus]|uniref:cytochrome c oxidase assembly factor 7 homolog n=1 Tax=Penaeus japonicus TaxID=27405 RepID=UPI001C70F0F2|nr:cytochrome c oxidase assembly factor 7 homolog [Penaeus japonicus]